MTSEDIWNQSGDTVVIISLHSGGVSDCIFETIGTEGEKIVEPL